MAHDADAKTRIKSALDRANEAQDAQDWERVRPLLRLADQAIRQHIAEKEGRG